MPKLSAYQNFSEWPMTDSFTLSIQVLFRTSPGEKNVTRFVLFLNHIQKIPYKYQIWGLKTRQL